ncbi:hypothetical protein K469DRAFT_718394 [Zopfia rhizophila CBS 207.26]|uniref:Tyrosinase copper-binding domain-containing protein n=1 Tax=Zopfia rhizophila CBS 207.26 TaxID=1314779 RepID=A0A6A6DL43_9PEZI|nr:hypothetical protein K469DRAFT_718394 [Zopfia rhizophila CBS 207.26]
MHSWHRVIVAWYEQALRDSCGYGGAQPYWDWTLDTNIPTFARSSVFNAVHGFGDNGAYTSTTHDTNVRLHIPEKT